MLYSISWPCCCFLWGHPRSQTAPGRRCLLHQQKDDWQVTWRETSSCHSRQVQHRGLLARARTRAPSPEQDQCFDLHAARTCSSGAAAAPGTESHCPALAAFPPLVAHHEPHPAALGAGRGPCAAFETAGTSLRCGDPAQSESYFPQLQGATKHLAHEHFQLRERRMR